MLIGGYQMDHQHQVKLSLSQNIRIESNFWDIDRIKLKNYRMTLRTHIRIDLRKLEKHFWKIFKIC